MGKKFLIVSVILVAIMFGMLFWKINEPVTMQQDTHMRDINDGMPSSMVEAQKMSSQKSATNLSNTTENIEELNLSDVENAQAVVESSPAAFGFMRQGSAYQIVGLLSTLDKNAPLIQYIKRLCKQQICNIDVGYQNDIKDVYWQEDVVGILKLFIAGEIESGSLFIQSDTLKLEGSARDAKSEKRLRKYLTNLKRNGLKIENHIAMQTDEKQEKNVLEEHKNFITVVTKKEDANVTKKESAKPHEVQEVAASQEKVIKSTDQTKKAIASETTKQTSKPQKALAKKIQTGQKVQHKTRRRKEVVHKKVVQRKPVKDIIAPSYMETSIDLARKIRSGVKKDDMEKTSRDTDDIVAKPKLEILR